MRTHRTAAITSSDGFRVDALHGTQMIAVGALLLQTVLHRSFGSLPAGAAILPTASTLLLVTTGYLLYRWTIPINRSDSPHTVRSHLLSHLLPILALWWVAVGAGVVFLDGRTPEGITGWLTTLTLTQSLFAGMDHPLVGSAWILSVQWLTVLMMPLWHGIFGRSRRRSSARRAEAIMIVTLMIAASTTATLRPFLPVLAGIGLARVDRTRRGAPVVLLRSLREPRVVFIATVGAWMLLDIARREDDLAAGMWMHDRPVLTLAWVALAALWCARATSEDGSRRLAEVVRSRRIRPFCGLALGVLVWHDFFVVAVRQRLGADVHPLALLHLVALGTFTAAAASRPIVEESVRRLRRWTDPMVRSIITLWPEPAASSNIMLSTAPHDEPGNGTRRAPLDAVRLLAMVGLLLSHAVLISDPSDSIRRTVVVIGWVAAAVWATMSAYLRTRPWIAGPRRIRRGSRASTPGRSRRTMFPIDRFLSVLALHWCVVAVVVAWGEQTAPGGVSGWLELLIAAPWRPDGTAPFEASAPVAFVITAELWFIVAAPAVGHLLRSLGRFGASTVLAAGAIGSAVIALALSLPTNRGVATGLLLCAAGGLLIASVEVAQRSRRRWLPGVRPLIRLPAIPLTIAIAILVATDRPGGAVRLAEGDLGPLFPTVALPAIIIVAVIVLSPARSPIGRMLGSPSWFRFGPMALGVTVWFPAILQLARITPGPGILVSASVSAAVAIALGASGRRIVEARMRSTTRADHEDRPLAPTPARMPESAHD